MRATFAVMEMHMRKRPHLVVLTELVAPEQTPVAQSKTASTFAQELSLEESLLARVACRHGTCRVMSNSVRGVAGVLVASEDQMIDQIKEHLEFRLVTAHLA